MSVVFDFNASLNDIAPRSLMSLSVVVKRKGKSCSLMDVSYLSSFFYLDSLDKVSRVLCLISMIHSMTLFLCLQSCFLLL